MADVTVDFFLEWTTRAATRWQNALTRIRKSEYGPKEWLADVVGFWMDDVADTWTDLSAGTSTILLTLGIGETTRASDSVPVPKPEQAKITDLMQLGGTKKIPQGTWLVLGKPSSMPPHTTDPGNVRVHLRSLNTLPSPLAAGELYMGLLYEDQKPLAHVLVAVT